MVQKPAAHRVITKFSVRISMLISKRDCALGIPGHCILKFSMIVFYGALDVAIRIHFDLEVFKIEIVEGP